MIMKVVNITTLRNAKGEKILNEINYSMLRGKIVEKYGTLAKFAQALGISTTALAHKLGGKAGWKQAEIIKACRLLDITRKEIGAYFFSPKS